MEITTTAWLAGLTGALLYLIFAWPLAIALSRARVIFGSFQVKLITAILIGAVCAPLAEHYTPQLLEKTQEAINQSRPATQAYNTVATFIN